MDDGLPPRAGTESSDPDTLTDAGSVPLPPVEWEVPPESSEVFPASDVLDVGDAFGRVLRTYAAGWRVFLVLALPSAILSAVGSPFVGLLLLSGAFIPLLAFGLVAALVGIVSSIAMMFATADLRAGSAPSVTSTTRRAIGRSLPVTGSFLAMGAVFVGLLFVLAVFGVIVRAGASGADTFGLFILIGYVAFVVITIRWTVAPAAASMGGQGPIGSLRESRRLTRRNAWRIFGFLFVLGLASAPLSIGLSLVSSHGDPLLVAIAVFAVTLASGPLLAIGIATAYGDLAGHPVVSPGGQAGDRGRDVLVGSLVGVSAIVLAVGVVLASQGGGRPLVAPDAGVILAGTDQNALNPCRPENRKTTFEADDAIYIGGYFSRMADANQPLTIAVYVDDVLVIRDTVSSRPEGVGCYYEPEALQGASPGNYRIQILNGGDTLADGRFTVR
jgi:uncharacterized membrane protein